MLEIERSVKQNTSTAVGEGFLVKSDSESIACFIDENRNDREKILMLIDSQASGFSDEIWEQLLTTSLFRHEVVNSPFFPLSLVEKRLVMANEEVDAGHIHVVILELSHLLSRTDIHASLFNEYVNRNAGLLSELHFVVESSPHVDILFFQKNIINKVDNQVFVGLLCRFLSNPNCSSEFVMHCVGEILKRSAARKIEVSCLYRLAIALVKNQNYIARFPSVSLELMTRISEADTFLQRKVYRALADGFLNTLSAH